jgi:hypothetical protein
MKKGCLPLVYGHMAAVSKWEEALTEDEFCVWLYWAAASNPADRSGIRPPRTMSGISNYCHELLDIICKS